MAITEIMIAREDEIATAILRAIRHIDDGEELAPVVMKLMDSEERCQMLREDVAKLSAIKATVEVIFGRKFDA